MSISSDFLLILVQKLAVAIVQKCMLMSTYSSNSCLECTKTTLAVYYHQ